MGQRGRLPTMPLNSEETKYEVLLGDEVIGRSNLEYRDTSMGVAHGSFAPTRAFAKVAGVFALFAESQGDTAGTVDEAKLRDYYSRRDSLGLSLRSAAGATIDTQATSSIFEPSLAMMMPASWRSTWRAMMASMAANSCAIACGPRLGNDARSHHELPSFVVDSGAPRSPRKQKNPR